MSAEEQQETLGIQAQDNGQVAALLTEATAEPAPRLVRPGEVDVLFDQNGNPAKTVYMGRRRKVCTVGFAETTKYLVPYEDTSYEVWSLNQHYRYMPRASRWFEIHQRKDYTQDMVEGTDYVGWLQRCPIPVYVTDPQPDMPTAIRFPTEAYVQMAGIWEQDRDTKAYRRREYTQSSLVYMLALALLERFETIGIYGVDLVVGSEYSYQKPNMEWLLGFAQGQGYEITRGAQPRGAAREVFIHQRSALLRQTYTYGPDLGHKRNMLDPLLRDRLTHLLDAKDKLLASLHNCDGAINETQQWIAMLDMQEKGGDVIWKYHAGHSVTVDADGRQEPVERPKTP